MLRAAAIVLAAGAGRRLGAVKPLVEHDGQTLVGRAVDLARSAGCVPIVVVTGAHAERVEAALAEHPAVEVVRNTRWEAGQGASVAAGIGHLVRGHPECAAALVLLCDQPLIPSAHLRALAERVLGGECLVAATRYPEGGGVPACFAAACFDELSRLDGPRGAVAIIRARPDATVLLDAPGALLDVDSPRDLAALRGDVSPPAADRSTSPRPGAGDRPSA